MRHRRRAFSIVELVVSLVIAAIVTAGVWSAFYASRIQSKATDVKLEGFKAALVFLERFENDFRRLYVSPARDITITHTNAGTTISFYVHDPRQSELDRGRIHITAVHYEFDASIVTWEMNGDGASRAATKACCSSVILHWSHRTPPARRPWMQRRSGRGAF